METITVNSITIHPDWNEAGGNGDYALIRLAQSSSITPVSLDTGSATSSYVGGEPVIVIGMGNTDSSTGGQSGTPPAIATRLQEVEINMMTTEECEVYRPITENQICANDESDEGSCSSSKWAKRQQQQ